MSQVKLSRIRFALNNPDLKKPMPTNVQTYNKTAPPSWLRGAPVPNTPHKNSYSRLFTSLFKDNVFDYLQSYKKQEYYLNPELISINLIDPLYHKAFNLFKILQSKKPEDTEQYKLLRLFQYIYPNEFNAELNKEVPDNSEDSFKKQLEEQYPNEYNKVDLKYKELIGKSPYDQLIDLTINIQNVAGGNRRSKSRTIKRRSNRNRSNRSKTKGNNRK